MRKMVSSQSDIYYTSTESQISPGNDVEIYSFIDKGWPSSPKNDEQAVRAVKGF